MHKAAMSEYLKDEVLAFQETGTIREITTPNLLPAVVFYSNATGPGHLVSKGGRHKFHRNI